MRELTKNLFIQIITIIYGGRTDGWLESEQELTHFCETGQRWGILCENKYSNASVYEQSVYEFSLIRDAQINTCFSIYEPIFAYTSSVLSQTDRCSCREVMGN
jgi:hypothetical protein